MEDQQEINLGTSQEIQPGAGGNSPQPGQETPSFEVAIQRLEEIVGLLDNGQAPLEEALALFEEGAKLLGGCTRLLDQAEEKIAIYAPHPETGMPVATAYAPEEE